MLITTVLDGGLLFYNQSCQKNEIYESNNIYDSTINQVRNYEIIDSLVIYDPYTNKTKDTIIKYDYHKKVSFQGHHIGILGNRVDLDLNVPTANWHSLTNVRLAREKYDVLAYPMRVHFTFFRNGKQAITRKGGTGVLIAPNVILTVGHNVLTRRYDSNNKFISRWRDSTIIAPAFEYGTPQPTIGYVKVIKCYVFKKFVDEFYITNHNSSDDIAIEILDKPIGDSIGWVGMGWTTNDSMLLNTVFYNFCYPQQSGFDGLNMCFKFGYLTSITANGTQAVTYPQAISGESGSPILYTNNNEYTVYGNRPSSNFTLISEHQFRIFKEIIDKHAIKR